MSLNHSFDNTHTMNNSKIPSFQAKFSLKICQTFRIQEFYLKAANLPMGMGWGFETLSFDILYFLHQSIFQLFPFLWSTCQCSLLCYDWNMEKLPRLFLISKVTGNLQNLADLPRCRRVHWQACGHSAWVPCESCRPSDRCGHHGEGCDHTRPAPAASH